MAFIKQYNWTWTFLLSLFTLCELFISCFCFALYGYLLAFLISATTTAAIIPANTTTGRPPLVMVALGTLTSSNVSSRPPKVKVRLASCLIELCINHIDSYYTISAASGSRARRGSCIRCCCTCIKWTSKTTERKHCW